MSRWLAALRERRACKLNESNNQNADEVPAAPVPAAPPFVEPLLRANKMFDSFNSHGSDHSLGPDPDAFFALLRDRGPTTYGAAGSALGWGATRAWQAADMLRRSGRVTVDHFGRMLPIPREDQP